MKWESGRQGTGYLKCLLAQGKTWDLYLIKYPRGACVTAHRDPAGPGLNHWRANLLLRGEDSFTGRSRFRIGPLVVFRPDVWTHWVKPVSRTRLVLSFGWVTKQ